jgi:arylsulfatase A-like enzyme
LLAGGAFAQTPVIVVSVDTLRADHVSAYGYRKIQTPHIDSFADQGTIFSQANSQIPLTLPSHTSLFTSTYPFENGVEENAEIVPASSVTLASVLRDHGYRTGAFIGSDLLAQRFHLDKGFDVYDSPFHRQAAAGENPYDIRVRRDAALVVRSAMQWLAAGGAKPPFLFLHFFDLHTPYSAAAFKTIQPNAAGYDAEIQYLDRVLGGLRRMLSEKGWWDRSLLILLSDHGESLGEHGEASHGYFVYQSTVRVPLMIHWPAQSRPLSATVDEPAGLIDVAPTILDFLHIQRPASFRGISLLRLVRHPIYSETMYAHDAFRWSALRSVREGELQYVDAPEPEIYDLRSDLAERQNLIREHGREAREMRDALRALLSSRTTQAVTRDQSAPTMNTLRSLGYIAGPARDAPGSSGPDPKARLAEYQAYERGLEALYEDREAQAVGILRQLLKQDTVNNLARYYLGEAYLRLQRPADALREWKAALAQDPTYTEAAQAIQKLSTVKR